MHHNLLAMAGNFALRADKFGLSWTRPFSFHRARMKLRNQLLALFCLLVFIGIGVLYFRERAGPQKPFGIILFVGDGLVASHLTAARLYEGGADHRAGVVGGRRRPR